MRLPLILAIAAASLIGGAGAQAEDLKIALIYGKTGPLEAYAKQTETGLRMGLEYATKGSMTLDGRKIVIITKDDQSKPDLSKAALAEAYQDDKADIAIGTSSSAAALADLPVAEENKKILIVEPAVADQITGEKWNRYIFRTGRNSSQDAVSNAVAIGKPGVTIATLGAGLCVRPRRRRRLQGSAGQNRCDAGYRRIRADHHNRFHRRRAAPVRRAKGQAGPQDHLGDLGGRRRSAHQAAGHGSETLRNRTFDRRQHPAGARGVQAAAGHGGRDLLLLRHPEEPGERLARQRTPEAFPRPAGFLHRGRFRGRDGRSHRRQQGEIHRHREADQPRWKAWNSTRPRAR